MKGRKDARIKTLLAVLTVGGLVSCGGSNYFTSVATKDSDAAIYHDVLKMVDQKDYDNALTKLASLSAAYRANADVVQTEAGIHAGKCGLDLLVFASGLSGSGSPFAVFKSGFTSLVVDPTECQTAQSMIENAFGSTSTSRVTNLGSTVGGNVNTFMAILGAAKIGTQLRATADPTQTGGVDASFDACSGGSLTNAQVAQVGTGLALLLTNIGTLAGQLGSSEDALKNLDQQCASLTPNPCEITNPNDSTWSDANVLLAFRSLVKSTAMGIQNCSTDNAGNPLPYPFDCCP